MEDFMCKLCGKSTCGLSVCCGVSVLTHYGNAGVCSRLHLGFVRSDGNSGRAPHGSQLAKSSYSCRSHNTRQRRPRPGPTHRG